MIEDSGDREIAEKEEDAVVDPERSDDDSSSGDEATPEWMSFASMPEAEVDLLSNFDALWHEDEQLATEDSKTRCRAT